MATTYTAHEIARAHRGRPIAPRVRALFASMARMRLVQFFVFGLLIFTITRKNKDDRTIDVSAADLSVALRAESEKHPMTQAHDVEERAVEDELLYREGLRLGFDREDGIVRQRVIQKTLYYAEELSGATQPPTDAELRAWYAAHGDHFLRPQTFTLQHVFAKDRGALEAILAQLHADPSLDPRALGEPSPLPFESKLARDRLAQMLGPSFVAALPAAPSSDFGAPIASTYGWHAVRVIAIEPEIRAPFESVRRRVEEEYVVARREEAIAKYLEKVFGEYVVRVDGVALTHLEPSRRLAVRTEASPED